MKNVWNSAQVELIFRSVLQRLKTAPDSLTVKVEGNEVKIDNIRTLTRGTTKDPMISIVLYGGDGSIYINLDDNSDVYRPSFWGDKNIKGLFKQIVQLCKTKGVLAEDIIVKCFPEAVDIQLEKVVLTDKI